MVYYFSVLCVAKYRSILDVVGRDETAAGVLSEPVPPPGENVGGNDQGDQQISDEGGPNSVFSGEGGNYVPAAEGSHELGHREVKNDVKNTQRLRSVDTDCSTTPDLDQVFHFPSPEGESGGGESSMPASVTFYRQSRDTSEQIEMALKLVGPFLCRLLVTNRSSLSRVLVGSDGRSLLTDGTIVYPVKIRSVRHLP